jgi:DNA excision repair protein ERCC-2
MNNSEVIDRYFLGHQKQMFNEIFNSMNNANHLLLESPTGTGKTYTAIVSSLLYTYDNKRQIIFAVRSYPLMEKILGLMYGLSNKLGLTGSISIIPFKGKEKICPISLKYSLGAGIYGYCRYLRNMSLCSYYVSYLNRYGDIHAYYKKLFSNMGDYSIRDFSSCDWCPYYAIKSFVNDADIIVTHYFNVLHHYGAFYNISSSTSPIVVLDEVHNIPYYYFDLYVSSLNKSVFDKFLSLNCISKSVKNMVKKFFSELTESKLSSNSKRSIPCSSLFSIEKAYILNSELTQELIKDGSVTMKKECRELIFLLKNFLDIVIQFYDEARIAAENEEFILFPEKKILSLSSLIDNFYSVIGLSATLSPFSFYKRILFGEGNNRVKFFRLVKYPSYLPTISLSVKRDYTSKYRNRTMSLIERVSKDIFSIAMEKGSLIVFSASKELSKYLDSELKRISSRFRANNKFAIINLDIADLFSEDILLDSKKEKIFIFLTSQRGRFSEGIDLSRYVENIVIFGLSITPSSVKDNVFMNYFLNFYSNRLRYKYTYLLPAIVFIVQSIGRLIREENKKINVYIFERRLLKKQILEMMPVWFKTAISKFVY